MFKMVAPIQNPAKYGALRHTFSLCKRSGTSGYSQKFFFCLWEHYESTKCTVKIINFIGWLILDLLVDLGFYGAGAIRGHIPLPESPSWWKIIPRR